MKLFKLDPPKPANSKSWIPVLIMLLILWLATGLRFYQISEQSFWNDEGNSARLSERSLPLIIEGTTSDIHPPLYYLILRGWRELVGESEFGLRSFSAFAGILTVAASLSLTMLLFREISGRKQVIYVILFVTFLAAVNPALIYYSQETRMYALLGLLSAVSTIALLRWLNAERRRYWAVLYIVTATAGLYTHYFFPAILLFQNLVVAIWSVSYVAQVLFAPFHFTVKHSLRRTLLSWVALMVIIFMLYLPWLPTFFRQVGGRPAQRETLTTFLWDSARWLAFGETISAGDLFWPSLAVIFLSFWALFVAGRRSIIPFLGVLLPVVFMYAAGVTQPAFFKFLLAAVPFFVILLGKGIKLAGWSNKSRLWLVPPAASLALVLLGTAFSLNNLYHNPAYERADYRGMAARIAAEAHPNAGIILNAPNQWEVFTYYHREGAPVYPLPKGQPDPAILEPQLAAIAENHDRLYALYWGEQQRDPDRVIESWLDKNTFKATEEWVGDVRFVIYAVPGGPVTEMDTPANLQFNDGIVLDGYTLSQGSFLPGDIVQTTLFWHTQRPIEKRYKVFLHLLDENGALVAQRDSEPGGGREITTGWLAGETIVDNHGLLLPPDLASGRYRLLLGMYDIQDPDARLSLSVDGEVQDSWTLGEIAVQ